MFKSSMEESTTGILKLSDMNFDTASVALRYIYTSEIRADFAIEEECESLLNFAEKYDVRKMKDDIEVALTRLLDAHNAFRFMGLAYQFELEELKAMAATLVHSNFMSEEILANMGTLFEKKRRTHL